MEDRAALVLPGTPPAVADLTLGLARALDEPTFVDRISAFMTDFVTEDWGLWQRQGEHWSRRAGTGTDDGAPRPSLQATMSVNGVECRDGALCLSLGDGDRPKWLLEVERNLDPGDPELEVWTTIGRHVDAFLQRSDRMSELQLLSTVDSVTGLYNARHLEAVLRREVSRCQRFGGSLCLLFIDLDRFKEVNDQLGHTVGTSLIAQIGRLLPEATRQTDYAFRYGGDEFAVLLVEASKEAGTHVGHRVRGFVREHCSRFRDARKDVTASVGVASFPGDASSVETLLARADAAMYAAKEAGRDEVYTLDLRLDALTTPKVAGPTVTSETTTIDVEENVILWDVMGTLVDEPFVEAMPRFFGMSLEQLIAEKDPHSWIRFERGEIDEDEYCRLFFNDRRPVDKAGLKQAMRDAYHWLPGTEELLTELNDLPVRMYALSNYSRWYELIEDKLRLSRYISWDFVSCHTGHRKPDPEAYAIVLERLAVSGDRCVFVDDRAKNVEGARRMGIKGILRPPEPGQLRKQLFDLGVPVRRA